MRSRKLSRDKEADSMYNYSTGFRASQTRQSNSISLKRGGGRPNATSGSKRPMAEYQNINLY